MVRSRAGFVLHCLTVVIAALLLTTRALASSAHFSRLSVEDGLSQSSVESIAEDQFGFLWFGTQEGLNRFDGYDFVVYQPSAKPGHLRDGFIRSITPDDRGNLWVGTTSGLQHLDVTTGRFSDSVTPAGVGVRLNTVRLASDGRIWFGGRDGGLWTVAPTRGSTAQLVTIDGIGSAAAVTAVAAGDDGKLWIAADGRLFDLQISDDGEATPSVRATPVVRDAGVIRVIHREGGHLWLGRDAAVVSFDPATGATTEHADLPRFVLTIASAGEGRLWIGGKGAGVTRFDPNTREIVKYQHEAGNENSLAENDVAVVHQDRGGSLWVGAWNGGLSRLDLYAQAFRTLRNRPGEPDSLPDDDVTRMAEGPDGRLWTMTRNEVLAVGDPRSGSFVTVPLDRDLTSIAFAGSTLFAGTTTGLVALDAATGRVVTLQEAARAAGLGTARIDAMASAGDHLWIIAGETLYRMGGGDAGVTRVPLPSSANGELTSMDAPSSDRLWIAYGEGLLLHATFADGAITVRRVGDNSVVARGRLSAVTEHHGTLWLGAALGIGRLGAGDRVEWMDLEQRMPSRSVASILGDDRGVLWIATERGITRFEPSTRNVGHFGAVQGAQPSGYVEGGATRGRSGLFYLAGRGITLFDPRQAMSNPHRPRVVFTALEVLHRPVVPSWMNPDSPLQRAIHAAEEVTLDPDAVVVSVAMAAPGVGDPEGVHFLHRLEGFDKEWIESGAARRVATYTRLAPGRYLLRARARTRSGMWSSGETTLRIRILPPWWRTPAAAIVWLVGAALAIVVIVHETRSRTRARVALAEQEGLRRASVTDPLTGLYNRRFLTAWMKHEVPRTLRTHHGRAGSDGHGEFLLFVVADLDNLKEINDRFGHDGGDRAIRAVGDLLQSHARAGDLAVRMGGDEFVLVLRSTDFREADHVVERLRASAETLDLHLGDAPRPTISLGFATFPFLGDDVAALTWEQTLQLADRALLQTKRRGRNAWSGFLAAPEASAAEVLQYLETAADQLPSEVIRVIEGPGGLKEQNESR